MARILVVDDDLEIVELIRDLLRQEGHAVETTTQSLRVYDKAKEFKPDLVLLDIMMPYLDGWDELKLFSRDVELRSIPVIVITADRKAAAQRHYGVVDTLLKPFDLAELNDKVHRALKSGEAVASQERTQAGGRSQQS